MDGLRQIRAARPDVGSPSAAVIAHARERLMRTIDQERSAADDSMSNVPGSNVTVLRRRRWIRPAVAAAAVAVVAAGAFTLTTLAGHEPPVIRTAGLTANVPARQVFGAAAALVRSAPERPAAQPIRHVRFRDLADTGEPVYDLYIRPDGTAMFGRVGDKLEETSGYLTADQLTSVEGDAAGMELRLKTLATTLGLGYPDERPERAIYRLAGDLLSDPAVPSATKAQVYDVLAGFDLDAIKASNLGQRTLTDGTAGIEVRFQFDEGTTDLIMLDPNTGALLADQSTLPDGEALFGRQFLVEETVASIP